MNLSSISKAIAAGVVTALVAEAGRYGWHPTGQTVSALGVIATALVGYVVGHIAVYIAPSNK